MITSSFVAVAPLPFTLHVLAAQSITTSLFISYASLISLSLYSHENGPGTNFISVSLSLKSSLIFLLVSQATKLIAEN